MLPLHVGARRALIFAAAFGSTLVAGVLLWRLLHPLIIAQASTSLLGIVVATQVLPLVAALAWWWDRAANAPAPDTARGVSLVSTTAPRLVQARNPAAHREDPSVPQEGVLTPIVVVHRVAHVSRERHGNSAGRTRTARRVPPSPPELTG